MAQLAIGVAGAAVGFYLGGPVGAQIGFALGSYVGGMVQKAIDGNHKTNSNQNLAMGSSWGSPIPLLYGTARVSGQMIWTGPQKTESSSGGKGLGGSGGAGSKTTQSFAVAFCEGPVDAVLRLWADGQLIFDARTPYAALGNAISFVFLPGTEDQLPDPLILDWVSKNVPSAPDAAPAFRGLAYVMFTDLDLTKFGSRTPAISAEISNSGQPNLPAIPLTPAPPDEDFEGSYGPFAVDWVRDVLYVPDSGAGYRVFSLADSTELGRIPRGVDGIQGELAAAQGGELYGFQGFGNYSRILKYDPDGYTLLSQLGATHAGLGAIDNTHDAFINVQSAFVVSVVDLTGSYDYLIMLQFAGNYAVVRGDTPEMRYVAGDLTDPGFVPLPYVGDFYARSLGVVGAQHKDYAEAYILHSEVVNGDCVYIMKLTVASGAAFLQGRTQGITLELHGTLHAGDFNPGAADWQGTGLPGASYDPADDTLILSKDGAAIKWSRDHGTLWRQTGGGIDQASFNPQSRVQGRMGFQTGFGQTFTLLDTRTGSILSTRNVTNDAPIGSSVFGTSVYDGTSNSMLSTAGTAEPYRAYLGLAGGGGYPVADILVDLCLRGGLEREQIDVSAIDSLVHGCLVDSNKSCKDAIVDLQLTQFFDVIESDFTLKFIPRGGAPMLVIPQTALSSVTRPEEGNYLQHTRAQEQELPTIVQVDFTDAANEYLPGTAYEKRIQAPVQAVRSKQRLVVPLPVALDVTAGQLVASRMLWSTWAERDTYATMTGVEYAWLDPGDVVDVLLDNGDVVPVRLTAIEFGADFALKLQGVGTDVQTYTQATTIEPVPSPYEDPPRGAAAKTPRLFLPNLPLLRDQDYLTGTGVSYFAAGSYSGTFGGGTLLSSPDGENYDQVDTFANGATWGSCVNALPTTNAPFSTDNSTRLVVALRAGAGTLASVSTIDLLNGKNGALVGDEVIQFGHVAENADGTVTLSTLLRGRRGTEWACGTHRAGDAFLLLDLTLHVRKLALGQNNMASLYKMQPKGSTLDTVRPQPATYKGWDQKPYAPVGFSRGPASPDLSVRWVRRTRVGGELQDGLGEVPLGEQAESYDAYVLAAPYDPVASGWAAPTSFLRPFPGLTAPVLTYTAAQMAADAFTPATDTLHVVVFQNSATIGHGWPGASDLAPF